MTIFYQASGFEIEFEEAAPADPSGTPPDPSGTPAGLSGTPVSPGETQGFAVLPEDAELAALEAGLRLLGPTPLRSALSSAPPPAPSSPPVALASPAAGAGSSAAAAVMPATVAAVPAASSDGSAAAAAAGSGAAATVTEAAVAKPQQPPANARRPRNTRVIFPAETDSRVDDWVFQRSPAELKQNFVAAQKKREQDQVWGKEEWNTDGYCLTLSGKWWCDGADVVGVAIILRYGGYHLGGTQR